VRTGLTRTRTRTATRSLRWGRATQRCIGSRQRSRECYCPAACGLACATATVHAAGVRGGACSLETLRVVLRPAAAAA
jgi:hypothetical protein